MEEEIVSLVKLLCLRITFSNSSKRGNIVLVEDTKTRNLLIQVLDRYLSTPQCFLSFSRETLFRDNKPIFHVEVFDCERMSATMYSPSSKVRYNKEDDTIDDIIKELDTTIDHVFHVFVGFENTSDDNQRDVEQILRSKNDEHRLLIAVKDNFVKDIHENRCWLYLTRECDFYDLKKDERSCDDIISEIINGKTIWENLVASKIINLYNQLYLSSGFNLLKSIHLSENDHSKILIDLLNSDDKIMRSFVEDVLGILYPYKKLKAYGQWPAIPCKDFDKNKGFIDILITDAEGPNQKGEIAIIIENKVCGASDMPYQLQRYLCTIDENAEINGYNKVNGEPLFAIPQNRNTIKDADIYLFYLTAISGIEPQYIENGNSKNKGSISKETVKKLSETGRYKLLSYDNKNGIIDWIDNLETDNQIKEQLILYRKYLDTAQELILPILKKKLTDYVMFPNNNDWCVNCSGDSQYIKFYKKKWKNKGETKNAGLHFSIDNCLSERPILRLHIENQWYKNNQLREFVFMSNGGFEFQDGVTSSISGGLWMMDLPSYIDITLPNLLSDLSKFIDDFTTNYQQIIDQIDKFVVYRDKNFPKLIP